MIDLNQIIPIFIKESIKVKGDISQPSNNSLDYVYDNDQSVQFTGHLLSFATHFIQYVYGRKLNTINQSIGNNIIHKTFQLIYPLYKPYHLYFAQ